MLSRQRNNMTFDFYFKPYRNDLAKSASLYKSLVYKAVKEYGYKVNELLLDRYLRKNFHKSLYQSCLYILNHLTIYKNGDSDYSLKTSDPLGDKLARLIMFGNGIVPGSSIINDCF